MKTSLHQPVLIDHVVSVLSPQPGECFVDGTAGFGGHAAKIIAATDPDGRTILVDRDILAIQALAERFGTRAEIIHASFFEAAERLVDDGTLADMILLDLGVSSPQLDNAERGFSFKGDAPLDMRMD